MRRLSKRTLVPLGLVMTVSYYVGKPVIALIWSASAAYGEVQTLKRDVAEMKGVQKEQADVLVAVKVSQASILEAIKSIRTPVINARTDAKDCRVCPGFQPGPFSMNIGGP
jgi:hypothetical protein